MAISNYPKIYILANGLIKFETPTIGKIKMSEENLYPSIITEEKCFYIIKNITKWI